MNFISVMDSLGIAASMSALIFLVLGARREAWRPETVLFTLIIVLTAIHNTGNFLGWAGITNWFDPTEDYLEVLTAALWAFFLYTFVQELTEARLRDIQELDEKILDGSPVAFVLRDVDLKILKVSKAFGTVTGYTPDDALGKKIDEFVPDTEGREELNARLKKVLETGEPVGPTEVKAPTPIPRYIREKIIPVADKKGRIINTLSVLEDITAQVEVERKLRAVQELDEKILDGSPVAFVLHDLDMNILKVSNAFERITGFSARDITGRHPADLLPPGVKRDEIIQRIQQVQDTGVKMGPYDMESFLPGRYLRETVLPVFDPDGKLVNTLLVLEDITEQKNARDALQASEERYRMLYNNIHDGVVLHEIDKDGYFSHFIEMNASFCNMTGYRKGELLEMVPGDLVDIEKYEDSETVRLSLGGDRAVSFERVLTRKSGEKIYCEMDSHPLNFSGQRIIFTVVRDISERKEAEERIKHSLAEKEMLLQEIHHRVKNNLQVISGLLDLQSLFIGDDKIRSIFKDSQNRIKTMALIHEELYQREDLARINMADYIRGLAHNLVNSYSIAKDRISLKLDLEDLDVTIDTAIPCGLIVNEIITNSLAHAFPGDICGEISVKFRSRKASLYEFTIEDNGIGLPPELDLKNTKTLGLRLVVLLSEQLGADFHVGRDSGTTFRLVFGEYHEAGTEMH